MPFLVRRGDVRWLVIDEGNLREAVCLGTIRRGADAMRDLLDGGCLVHQEVLVVAALVTDRAKVDSLDVYDVFVGCA